MVGRKMSTRKLEHQNVWMSGVVYRGVKRYVVAGSKFLYTLNGTRRGKCKIIS
jgi:hypothetical protein